MARLRNITSIEGSGGLPPGTVVPFGGVSAPNGWLLCDGSEISRSTYADLFAAISTHHGAGNGSTTFNIPDLRQRFVLGKAASGTGSVLGTTGGSIDHTHTVPAHYHAMGSGADLNITSSGSHTTSIEHDHATVTSTAGTAHTHGHTLGTSGGTAHSHSLSGLTLGTATTGISVVSNGAHTHPITVDNHSGSSGTQSADHTHSFSATSSAAGDHYHGIYLPHNIGAGGGTIRRAADASSGTYDGFTHQTSGPLTGTYPGTSSPNHTHSVSGTTGTTSTNHSHTINHGHTASSSSAGAHVHSISDPGHTHTATGGTVDNESTHTHTITGSISNESAHTHDVDLPNFVGNSSSDGSHSHATGSFAGRIGLVTGGVDGNSSMTSGSQNPPFYVLNYIIKI